MAKQTCKEVVAEILPSTGAWWGAFANDFKATEELAFKNIPYHACDIEWIKKYIKNYLFKQCSFIKLIAINKYLNSGEFLEQLKEYQNKIIDWQVNYTYSILNQDARKNAGSKGIADKVFEEVYKILTEELNMDIDVVAKRLQETKPQQVNTYNKKHNNRNKTNNRKTNSVSE